MKMKKGGSTSAERVGKLYSWGSFGFRPLSKEYMEKYEQVFETPELKKEKEEKRRQQDIRAAEAKAEKQRLMKLIAES
jgi:hypothetical protein